MMKIPNGTSYKEVLAIYSVNCPTKMAKLMLDTSEELAKVCFDTSKFMEEYYLRYVYASSSQKQEIQCEYIVLSLIVDAVRYVSRLKNPRTFSWAVFLNQWLETKN